MFFLQADWKRSIFFLQLSVCSLNVVHSNTRLCLSACSLDGFRTLPRTHKHILTHRAYMRTPDGESERARGELRQVTVRCHLAAFRYSVYISSTFCRSEIQPGVRTRVQLKTVRNGGHNCRRYAAFKREKTNAGRRLRGARKLPRDRRN